MSRSNKILAGELRGIHRVEVLAHLGERASGVLVPAPADRAGVAHALAEDEPARESVRQGPGARRVAARGLDEAGDCVDKWALLVDAMPRVRQHSQPGRRDRALEQ